MKDPYCTAIVLAAGRGSRMGTALPKQYLRLGDRPLLCYALQAFQDFPRIQEILLVIDAQSRQLCRELVTEAYAFPKLKRVIEGGRERFDSVWNALQQVEPGYVFIQDGARPFLSQEILERTYQAVRRTGACAVGVPVKDTIKRADPAGYVLETPAREGLWTIQTPQAFELSLLKEAYAALHKDPLDRPVTDDAMVVESRTGHRGQIVMGSYDNLKITTPEDLALAEFLLQRKGLS